jgi:hypothetical protein
MQAITIIGLDIAKSFSRICAHRLAKQGGFSTEQGWLFGRNEVIVISS